MKNKVIKIAALGSLGLIMYETWGVFSYNRRIRQLAGAPSRLARETSKPETGSRANSLLQQEMRELDEYRKEHFGQSIKNLSNTLGQMQKAVTVKLMQKQVQRLELTLDLQKTTLGKYKS